MPAAMIHQSLSVPAKTLSPLHSPAASRAGHVQLALLMLACAFLIRLPEFGNALSGEDGQFYLVVGDQVTQGALPYVDIWDRKPFLLFALFAGFRLFGGDGFLVAQAAAAFAAAATSFVIASIARRWVGMMPAAGAGVFYLLLVSLLNGDATQTPIFYNLLVATAAWLALRIDVARDASGDVWRACLAMLLCGLAIQIKTNAVFEGAAIGLWILARMWPVASLGTLLRRASLFALMGLLPTILVAAGYAAVGHFDAWWFANLVSQLRKEGGYAPESLTRLAELAPLLAVMALTAVMGFRRLPPSPARTLVMTWACFAFVDTFAIGNFWWHYALPFTVPVSILSAALFAIPRGRLLFLLLTAYPLADAQIIDRIMATRARQTLTTTLAAIPSDTPTQCLLAYEIPAAYYLLTRACLVTPYIFVDHLRSSAEAGALPIDAGTALREALARKPGTILTLGGSQWRMRNRVNDAILADALQQGYRLTARLPFRRGSVVGQTFLVWRRNDLPAR
jgi:hypothetical protein